MDRVVGSSIIQGALCDENGCAMKTGALLKMDAPVVCRMLRLRDNYHDLAFSP